MHSSFYRMSHFDSFVIDINHMSSNILIQQRYSIQNVLYIYQRIAVC